jgi:hypothetical protein
MIGTSLRQQMALLRAAGRVVAASDPTHPDWREGALDGAIQELRAAVEDISDRFGSLFDGAPCSRCGKVATYSRQRGGDFSLCCGAAPAEDPEDQ